MIRKLVLAVAVAGLLMGASECGGPVGKPCPSEGSVRGHGSQVYHCKKTGGGLTWQ